MVQLCLTAKIKGQATTACSFTISVNNGPFVAPDTQVLDQSIFIVPDDAASIVVRAEPFDVPKYRPLECELAPQADGGIAMVGGPAEFEPPTVFNNAIASNILSDGPLRSSGRRLRASPTVSGPKWTHIFSATGSPTSISIRRKILY